MKKISLFVAALAIGFAGFAQTTPAASKNAKPATAKDTKAPAKKDDKKATATKKTDAKTTTPAKTK